MNCSSKSGYAKLSFASVANSTTLDSSSRILTRLACTQITGACRTQEWEICNH